MITFRLFQHKAKLGVNGGGEFFGLWGTAAYLENQHLNSWHFTLS